LCRDIDQEIESVYHTDNPKRPSRVSDTSKTIKEAVSKHTENCIFLGEFPSVQGRFENASLLITDDTASPYETQSEPKSPDESFTYDDLQRALLLGKDVIGESYELQRLMGTQVVVYLLADLDRYWKEEQPHAIPVLYFYRGYSLSMETTRKINEKCKAACRDEGLDVIVTAADGEFNTIMVRGRDNKPLTQHQLSKDVWKDVCKFSKSQIIQVFLQKCKPVVPTHEILENNTLQTDGGTMKRIKTPSKGWVIHNAKRIREESEIKPIENEQDDNTVTVSEEVEETEEPEAPMNTPDETETHQDGVQINVNEIFEGLKRVNSAKWTDISQSTIADIFQSADSLSKLTVKELTEIAKCLNRRHADKKLHIKVSGVLKYQLVNSISKQVGDGSQIVQNVSAKKRNVPPLKQLAQRVIMKKAYPKRVLNIALANFLWPDKLREWKENARVKQTIDIIGVSQSLSPYYVPDKSEDGDFEVFVYDKTHLGSNLRKAICLNKVSGVSKKAWDNVSRMKPEILNPLLIEVSPEGKIADQMKERFARNMVSDDVEKCMNENGNLEEATFCKVIREGLYEADDTPGIPAIERCEKRLKLINWLDKGVDFGEFPPYGASIKGLSIILYEGLRSSSEAKLYLYALAKNGTYCVRAPNTLCSESFFSTMQEMDPWGQGVLTADGIEKHISDFTAITAMKMKDDRYLKSTLTYSEIQKLFETL
jgi:hypothetical protein